MNAQTESLELVRSYAWGLDLSGTPQGAGGVGGLLLVHQPSTTLAPCYDPNGNITAYVDCATGKAAHEFEYDPFGAELGLDTLLTGTPAPEPPPFRFSTKYTDAETALVYYGYRYYAPEMGRWTARDPIGEKGGVNIYEMTGNDALNQIDILGMNPGWFTGSFGGVGGTAGLGLFDYMMYRQICDRLNHGETYYYKAAFLRLLDVATGANFGEGESYWKITKILIKDDETGKPCNVKCTAEVVVLTDGPNGA